MSLTSGRWDASAPSSQPTPAAVAVIPNDATVTLYILAIVGIAQCELREG